MIDNKLIKRAIHAHNEGQHITHIKNNTTARIAHSKKYRVGDVVRAYGKDYVFMTSIRWECRHVNGWVMCSNGGYLVMTPKGRLKTLINIHRVVQPI